MSDLSMTQALLETVARQVEEIHRHLGLETDPEGAPLGLDVTCEYDSGHPGTWYLAICQGCNSILSQPFRDPAERDRWTGAHHGGTGHVVVYIEERS